MSDETHLAPQEKTLLLYLAVQKEISMRFLTNDHVVLMMQLVASGYATRHKYGGTPDLVVITKEGAKLASELRSCHTILYVGRMLVSL